MISINYPPPDFQIKKENGQSYIFDSLRKTWLLLTEEEWVRQNLIRYLITVLHYPAAMIAVEKEIVLNQLKKRFDVLVYDSHFQPWMLIECKAPQVPLDDAVLQQVLRYNISVPVSFLLISNGNNTYGWRKNNNLLESMEQLPQWDSKLV